MQLLILFILCFFLVLYILVKLKQNRFLRRCLCNNGILLSVTILLSMLVAIFRNYLFGYVVYTTMFYLVFDLICFILKHCSSRVYHAFRRFTGDGLWIFILAIGVTTLSCIHVKHIVVTDYEVVFEKPLQRDYRLMLITDMHLGTATKEVTFDRIESAVIENQPDVIIFAGDIFDESTSNELMEVAYQRLSSLASENQVYFILGNHEYVRGDVDELVNQLTLANVHVLIDEGVLFDNQFYLIGRMDKYNSIVSKEGRSSLEDLLMDIDRQYPIVLVDHQPVELERARELGVDLVLSGHTHAGQFFPLSFFAYFVNERLYGMKVEPGEWVEVEEVSRVWDARGVESDDKEVHGKGVFSTRKIDKVIYRQPFFTIVSSGIGAWGMAMRNASNSEIVIIELTGQ